MTIIEITKENFERFKVDLIHLNDQFLSALNIFKERTLQHKVEILQNMIQAKSPTHLLLGQDEEGKSVGMVYFNEGTGYSCGGAYIWINSIYVIKEAQSKGYGTALLTYIENWAKNRHFTLIISSRDLSNDASKKLFSGLGYQQSEMASMTKVLI